MARCYDTRKCFAKKEVFGGFVCDFLETTYPNGECPFRKEKIEDKGEKKDEEN